MKRLFFGLWLGLLPLMLFACGTSSYAFHGSPYQAPSAAPDFQVRDSNGELFHLSEMQGTSILLYFGYTFCPDICPATLADVRWVFQNIGESNLNTKLVFISLDPDRDSPEVIDAYLRRFHPEFIGLHVVDSELNAIKAAYGVFSEKESSSENEPYLISHTSRIFLIDQSGWLVTNYGFGTPREEILADLQYLH